MPEITITPTGPDRYEVAVTDGSTRTTHAVSVPTPLVERLGIADLDREVLVRASFEFLLEREPATSIRSSFELDVIERYFPGYTDAIRRRLR